MECASGTGANTTHGARGRTRASRSRPPELALGSLAVTDVDTDVERAERAERGQQPPRTRRWLAGCCRAAGLGAGLLAAVTVAKPLRFKAEPNRGALLMAPPFVVDSMVATKERSKSSALVSAREAAVPWRLAALMARELTPNPPAEPSDDVFDSTDAPSSWHKHAHLYQQ